MGWSRDTLVKVAARTGYPVKLAWVDGHGEMGDIVGAMEHHTGTPNSYMASSDMPTLKILREGRSDLPGPLCNSGLGRSGTHYLVSNGIGWHAGPGSYRGVTSGNSRFWGIEAENGGRGATVDPWPAEQLDSYTRLVASIHYELGYKDTTWNIRHATWALPAGRKVDTQGFSQTEFDRKVQRLLDNPRLINKNADTGGIMANLDDEDRAWLEKLLEGNRPFIASAVWAKGLPSEWSGGQLSAAAMLSRAENFGIEGGYRYGRPAGNKYPGTPTYAAEVFALLNAILAADADDVTLDQLTTALNEKLGSGSSGQLTRQDIVEVLNNLRVVVS